MTEIDKFMHALGRRSIDGVFLGNGDIAHVLASGDHVLSQRQVAGLDLAVSETADGIAAHIRVARDVRTIHPLHLCFGVLPADGRQHIALHLRLDEGSALDIIAHCFFPEAEHVEHTMQADIVIGDRAHLNYHEAHYHGPHGGATVVPRATVSVGKNASYRSDFSLTTGRVGRLDIDYDVDADDEALVELTARVFGHDQDAIRIRERLVLAGRAARGLIKTRIAVEGDARAEIIGITEGNAEHSRGHIDCLEIVKDRAIASAQPLVKVTHPKAKVTHEAAIGSVDRHQMETLMAHGLSPEEAVDLIVGGILGRQEAESLIRFQRARKG